MTDRGDLQVGDEITVVVTKPHKDQDRDPMTQIDNTATFIRFEDDYTPDFGETVRVKVADISGGTYIVVCTEAGVA